MLTNKFTVVLINFIEMKSGLRYFIDISRKRTIIWMELLIKEQLCKVAFPKITTLTPPIRNVQTKGAKYEPSNHIIKEIQIS